MSQPQKVWLVVQPETLWGKSQKLRPVGSWCRGQKQLHTHACLAATKVTLLTNIAYSSLGTRLKVLDPVQDLYAEEGHYCSMT